MEKEPTMPDFGIQDPPEVTGEDQQGGQQAPVEDKNDADQDPENSYSPPNEFRKNQEGEKTGGEKEGSEQNIDAIVESWQEDRKLIDEQKKELAELRKKQESEIDLESDEYADLSDKEKFDKAFEKRKEIEERQAEIEKREVESEARFMRAKSPYFRDNESEIMQVAAKYGASSLEQAELMHKGQKKAEQKAEADKKYKDSQKKNASGTSGGSGKPGTGVGGYNPKEDANKSIGDLYREQGF